MLTKMLLDVLQICSCVLIIIWTIVFGYLFFVLYNYKKMIQPFIPIGLAPKKSKFLKSTKKQSQPLEKSMTAPLLSFFDKINSDTLLNKKIAEQTTELKKLGEVDSPMFPNIFKSFVPTNKAIQDLDLLKNVDQQPAEIFKKKVNPKNMASAVESQRAALVTDLKNMGISSDCLDDEKINSKINLVATSVATELMQMPTK